MERHHHRYTESNFHEPAAFNAMLTTPGSTLGQWSCTRATRSKVHWFTTAAQDGYHVDRHGCHDRGQAGTIVLNSKVGTAR